MALPRIRTQAEYDDACAEARRDPEGYWADLAGHFTWHRKWDSTLQWDFEKPDVKWFIGGQLNITAAVRCGVEDPCCSGRVSSFVPGSRSSAS